jgi:hypothetical protein
VRQIFVKLAAALGARSQYFLNGEAGEFDDSSRDATQLNQVLSFD